jgi:hypothetical protein
LAVASALDQPVFNDPRPRYLRAILSNLNYEARCNPVNVCYIIGLGWKPQQQVVHQYAMNDRRALPPDLPIGNIQAGFMWLDNYKEELRSLSYPSDESGTGSYPIYDRWADSFNVQTEFVVVNQARALGTAAFLMAQTALKSQPWKAAAASISVHEPAMSTGERVCTATLNVPDLPLSQARIVWEAEDQQPAFGTSSSFTPKGKTTSIEAEVCLPDGAEPSRPPISLPRSETRRRRESFRRLAVVSPEPHLMHTVASR